MAYGELNVYVTDNVTWPEVSSRDPNTLKASLNTLNLENSWRCYL